VTRGGRRFVAEVKTGAQAPSLATAATRRQLLEYRQVFAVDGVLLVDVEAGRVAEVLFAGAAGEGRAPLVLVAIAIALVVAALLVAGRAPGR
jgi:hypothetical protein